MDTPYDIRLKRQRQYDRRRLSNEENRQERLQRENERRKAAREKTLNEKRNIISNMVDFIDENDVEEHSLGPMTVRCNFCGSYNFNAEKSGKDNSFTICCQKGKVKLDDTQLAYPQFLEDLLTNTDNPYHQNFRKNIRSYNAAHAFASMGANIAETSNNGPYVFKIHGTVYHRTSHYEALNGEIPQFGQLYILDSDEANDYRMDHEANTDCKPELMEAIDDFLRIHNRIADCYQMISEIQIQQQEYSRRTNTPLPIINFAFKRDRRTDPRRFNSPSANEVGMIFVNDDGEPPFERDIRIYPRNPSHDSFNFVPLSILSPNADPMIYPLLFPYGQAGWQPNWQCSNYRDISHLKRTNVSMLEYKSALFVERGRFNPVLHAGKLTHQFMVDSYMSIEANNLNYIRSHQNKLRRDFYSGLMDQLTNESNEQGVRMGQPVILPSTFEGSPRNQREKCADAMALFSQYGPGDLFITMTSNPQWKEIVDNLMPGERPEDRPDLIARVFRHKLRELINDLTINHALGVVLCYVYTIEYQKRGMPHAHIIITLRSEDKFTSIDRINQIVNAEIPNPEQFPRLHEIVKSKMIHAHTNNSQCMVDGRCSKKFPKKLQNETIRVINSYPLYRRRGLHSINVRGLSVSDQYVVPYNPFLLLKYNCHINVEICPGDASVKYIYKYIFKGYDSAVVRIGTQPTLLYNEIEQFIEGRYVSAPEAIWRIFKYPTHKKSHTIIRLPVHLKDQQTIIFEEGLEQEALQQARGTKLEKFFELNTRDEFSKQLLYTEIPQYFKFEKGEWIRRAKTNEMIISRMYTVTINDEERFYLRMLLLHIKGPKSYEDLRTVNGVMFETFKQTAEALNLLSSDEEWDRCLSEAATFQLPQAMRHTFALILIFGCPCNPKQLFEKFIQWMMIDYIQHYTFDESVQKLLSDIEFVLNQHNKTCAQFGLPISPTQQPQIQLNQWNPIEEKQECEKLVSSMNNDQLNAFNQIIQAMNDQTLRSKLFSIDGPGGSGKSFIYNALISYCRSNNLIVLPFASTGIAATLLKGGRTVHNGFKLPVPLLETSVSSIKLGSEEACNLRSASLILVDEITMLNKHALRCIDILLKEICCSSLPCGGKTLVVGGDFRQTLPIIKNGNDFDMIQMSMKCSYLWPSFQKLTLHTNMRSYNQPEFNNWLMEIGNGTHRPIDNFPHTTVEIPQVLLTKNSLIEEIYGQNVMNENCDKVIITPTNKTALEINNEIISNMPGNATEYISADSIDTEDPSEYLNYPVEFLNSITPSGFPPNKLNLKVGTIVMLLRNLNPKAGLCNGTRLMILELKQHIIVAKVLSEFNKNLIVQIPRIDLINSDYQLPIKLRRRQFPIIPAFAITINKSQGQSYDKVGVYLDQAVFSHGQLYVALSRCRHFSNLKIVIDHKHHNLTENNKYTSNIVNQAIFY